MSNINLCDINKYYKQPNRLDPLKRKPAQAEDIELLGYQKNSLTLRLSHLSGCKLNNIAGLSIDFQTNKYMNKHGLIIEGSIGPSGRSPNDSELEQIRNGELSESISKHGIFTLSQDYTIGNISTNSFVYFRNAILNNSQLTTPRCQLAAAGVDGSLMKCSSVVSGTSGSVLNSCNVISPTVINSGFWAEQSIFNTINYRQELGSLLSCTIAASAVSMSNGNILDSSISFHNLYISGGYTNSSFIYNSWPGATGNSIVNISGLFPKMILQDSIEDEIATVDGASFGSGFFLQCPNMQLSGLVNLNGTILTENLKANYLGLGESANIVCDSCVINTMVNTGIFTINKYLDTLSSPAAPSLPQYTGIVKVSEYIIPDKGIINYGSIVAEGLSGLSPSKNISLSNYSNFVCSETGSVDFGLINSGTINMPLARTISLNKLSRTLPKKKLAEDTITISTGINAGNIVCPSAILSFNNINNDVSGDVNAFAITFQSNTANDGRVEALQDIYLLGTSINQYSGVLKASSGVFLKESSKNYGTISGNNIHFLNSSINFGSTTGNIRPWTFFDNAVNSGNLLIANFKDSSHNYGSISQGTFDNFSINFGQCIISGNQQILFTGVSINLGTIENSGLHSNLVFSSSGDFKNIIINDINWGNEYITGGNSGYVLRATFRDNSKNYGTAIDCHFRDKSINISGYSFQPTFFNLSSNYAQSAVKAKFYDTSTNTSGGFVTSGNFYHKSTNYSSGEALSFYDNSLNLNLSNGAYFYNNSVNHFSGTVYRSIFYNTINSGLCKVNPGRGWDVLREFTIFSGSNSSNMGECIDGKFYFLNGAKNGRSLSGYMEQGFFYGLPSVQLATGVYFSGSAINNSIIKNCAECVFESNSSNYGMIYGCESIRFNNSTNYIGLKFFDPTYGTSDYLSDTRDNTDRWSAGLWGYGMVRFVNKAIFSGSTNYGLFSNCYNIVFEDKSVNNQSLSATELSFLNSSQNNSPINASLVIFSGSGINKGKIYADVSFINNSINEAPIISGYNIVYSGYSINYGSTGIATNKITFNNSFNNATLTVSGAVDFEYYSYNNGTLVANSYYYTPIYPEIWKGNVISFNQSVNMGTIISGIVYFTNNSINSGVVIGQAIFDNTSVNSGTVIPTGLRFYDAFNNRYPYDHYG